MVNLGIIENIAGDLINIAIMFIAILVIGGIIVGVYVLLLKQKRYREFKCVIWDTNDKGDVKTESYDSAGIFVDKKTNNKRFFIKKANVGLSPDKIPYIQTEKGGKVVYLVKAGLKNFRPIIPPKITEEQAKFVVGEEDVNWAINAYESQKKSFSTSKLLQYMPYILFGFSIMAILIIFIYFFKQFPVLKDVAQALREAAEAIARSRAGTIIME